MSTASTSRPLPRPLHLVSHSTGDSNLPTPLSTRANGPLSAPLSLNAKESKEIEVTPKRNPRRQSSISYNTGSAKTRSPASGLGRSNSVGSKVVLTSERTCGHEPGASKVASHPEVRETEPITLAEKHADLLRFIAQKESKCLELRTQLAQHEADLLLLKRKWERIVSKGLPSSARSDAVPTSIGSEMLGGIREGVQSGLGRVFAALEPTALGPSTTSQPPLSTPSSIKTRRHSQSTVTESSTSSSNRESISTTSSVSTWDRSSFSGSRSSAGSLCEDLPPSSRRSSSSSIHGGNTAGPSLDTEEASAAARSRAMSQNPSSHVHSPAGEDTGTSMPEDDLSPNKRRSRPTSVNLSQFTSSFSSLSENSTALSRQMVNWVPPGLNKKWEELKGNETLSKQSKRASTLLNDVLAVLAPPTPPSKTQSSKTPKEYRDQFPPSSHHNFDASFFDSICSEPGSTRVLSSPSPSSLLDEEDECKLGELLQPQVKVLVTPKVDQNKNEDKEEEDWNW